MELASFEGVILDGEYGGGTVMVWDKGAWTQGSEDVEVALKKRGPQILTSRQETSRFLWCSHRDRFASSKDMTVKKTRSAVSSRLLADISREEGGDEEKASTGDPAPRVRQQSKANRTSNRKRGTR